MNKKIEIVLQDNRLVIQGDIDFSNVMTLYEKSLPFFASLELIAFDLAKITSSHSAIIALMIEWKKYAKQLDKKIQFVNISPNLLTIAKVADLDALLVNEKVEV